MLIQFRDRNYIHHKELKDLQFEINCFPEVVDVDKIEPKAYLLRITIHHKPILEYNEKCVNYIYRIKTKDEDIAKLTEINAIDQFKVLIKNLTDDEKGMENFEEIFCQIKSGADNFIKEIENEIKKSKD